MKIALRVVGFIIGCLIYRLYLKPQIKYAVACHERGGVLVEGIGRFRCVSELR